MLLFSIYISLFLILLSGFFYYKNKLSNKSALFFSLLVFIVVGINLIYFVCNKLTGNGIDESVLYHITMGLQGAGFGDYKYLFIISTTTLLLVAMFLFFIFKKAKKQTSFSKVNHNISFVFLFSALFFSPAIPDINNLYSIYYDPFDFLAFIHGSSANNQEEIAINNNAFTKLYGENPVKKIGENKNFVFIYLEGLEATYSDENIFPGLTKNLNRLKEKSTYFSNLKQTNGAGFTIAGMVAGNCGIPLYSPSHGNTMSGIDKYLPGATCLGDILDADNYYLSFYGGANIGFAGKKLFLKNHGFDEIKGLYEILPFNKNPSYLSNWGIYDDSIFDLVYNRFLQLSSKNDNFGLFTLTLDTHHPEGNPSKTCDNLKYKDGENKMLNAVLCSDYLVGNLVDKILSSQYKDNTVVVIASDHLGLENTATNQLDKQERHNRLMIISPDSAQSKEITYQGSTIDIASTFLPFIGYEGDVGLGRNISDINNQEEIKFIQNNIIKESWRDNIMLFWNFPKIEKEILIDTVNKTTHIDDRKFKIPIMIEISSEMQTNLKFSFDVFENLDLISSLKEQGSTLPFLLIDKCERINDIYKNTKEKEFCLLINNNKNYSLIYLEKNNEFTIDNIREMISNKN